MRAVNYGAMLIGWSATNAMKLLAVIVILISLSAQTVEAQNLLWAKRAGGTAIDLGSAIAVDPAGNSYVTGRFGTTATFGPGEANQTLLTTTGQDAFVAKYNLSGQLQWVRQASGLLVFATGITVDSLGNSYVSGYFSNTITFAPGTVNQLILTATGPTDLFVAKYDTSGNFLWARHDGGASATANAMGMTLDGAGNNYVTGRFAGTVTFGLGEANQTTMTATGTPCGGANLFLAKYNSNGGFQWVKRVNNSPATGIAGDGIGNSWVVGEFCGPATFGLGEAGETILTAAVGTKDIFIAQYNSAGALQWAKRIDTTIGSTLEAHIAVDISGNSYVTGLFRGSATFAPGEGAQTTLVSDGNEDIFVAKYNPSGALQWARRAGGTGIDFGTGIAADIFGNSYVTGYFRDAPATFGAGELNETILTSAGNEDVFVAKYNTFGFLKWARRAGGGSDDRGLGIVFDNVGSALVAGRFAGIATFGPDESNQTVLTSANNFDIFVAKFANCRSSMDFDGDCKSDVAVYRDGLWIILRSSDGGVTATQFGGGTDVPLPADYDGDGKADIAVYRNGLWIILRSSDGGVTATQFGGGTDVPLPADYDGDGKADIAVYRNGLWIILRSSDSGVTATNFGGGTDIPIPADYDGDGKTDIAVYRSGLWIYAPSSGGANVAVQFGGGTDIPMPADYDGDGKTDIAVYRNGLWIYSPSSGGANVAVQFGGGTDVPLN